MPTRRRRVRRQPSDRPVRYAVAGLGYIAQVAVLPAFAHAKQKAKLVALISDDSRKLSRLGARYGVTHRANYDHMEECLAEAEAEALYIALPNHLHREYTMRAARAGVHVLCEKPMAVSERECRDMIAACDRHRVKLMIAYRLHFDKANLRAIELARGGDLGKVRFFNSVFSLDIQDPDNIRLDRERGGGTLYDIGIYCINAARYVFRAEPTEVMAFAERGRDPRFREVDEMTSAVLRFPGNRLATFTSSFGASKVSHYRVVGTGGDLVVDPAYDYATRLKHRLTRGGRARERAFARSDQFAPLLINFADCIRRDRAPEPDGREGLADVRIIEAIYESARSGRAVSIRPVPQGARPAPRQRITRRPIRKPNLVDAAAPTAD